MHQSELHNGNAWRSLSLNRRDRELEKMPQ
jgi:hypothetical protein